MNKGKLPWSYAEDDAEGFFIHESALALFARDKNVAGNGDDPASYISQLLNARRQIEIFGISFHRPGFYFHVLADFVTAALKYIARFEQDVSPEGRLRLGPCWKSGLGCFDGFNALLFGDRGALPNYFASGGGNYVEGRVIGDLFAVD